MDPFFPFPCLVLLIRTPDHEIQRQVRSEVFLRSTTTS